MTQSSIYQFADGSGNRSTFDVRDNTFTYDPIQPMFSSSGNYSGGEPLQKKLSDEEVKTSKQLLERFVDEAKKSPQTTRTKGTYLLHHGNEQFVLPMRHEVGTELEQHIMELRGPDATPPGFVEDSF